jgi:hypothetical protein
MIQGKRINLFRFRSERSLRYIREMIIPSTFIS